MAARAIWKGTIVVSDWKLPVKLYSAVEDRRIHFHLLHDQDLVRVRQRLVNSRTNATVDKDAIQRGYEVSSNTFVVLSEDELAKLEPTESRTIHIEHFVKKDALGPQWYDRPYWLGPDGDAARYFALTSAMAGEHAMGLARWTMRKRRYRGVLLTEGEHLGLVTLQSADAIIPQAALEAPPGRPLDKRESQLADQLVEALQTSFQHDAYKNEYRERLMNLIDAKRHGDKVEVEAVEPKPRHRSLEASLRASLKSLR